MNFYGFDTREQKLKTDAEGIRIDRAFIAHFQVGADKATAGDNAAILVATELTAEAQTITENIAQPNIPRNISVVGNVAGIAGNVTISGTNYNNDPITETLVLNGNTAVLGNKAFKTITEVDLPVQTADGNTVSIGVGEKLGLPYKLSNKIVLYTSLDNILETTAPTLTIDPEVLENNTVKLNSALDGKVVDMYFLV